MPTGKYERKNLLPKEERKCEFCNFSFVVKVTSKRKYCSKSCSGKSTGYKKGDVSSFKGKHHTKESIQKITLANEIRWSKPEEHEKSSKVQKEVSARPEIKKQRSEVQKKRFSDPKERELQSLRLIEVNKEHPELGQATSERNKIRWSDPECAEKQIFAIIEGKERTGAYERQSKTLKQTYIDHPEKGLKMSEIKKQYYKDHPEKCKEIGKQSIERHKDPKMVKKIFGRRKATKPERKFLEIIETNEFPFFFNGYLQNENPVLIGTKTPDFVHNTKKMVIEVYGDRPHANPHKYNFDYITPYGKMAKDVWRADKKRIKFIKSQGYEVLVIWSSELKDEAKVIKKVRKFLGEGEKKQEK